MPSARQTNAPQRGGSPPRKDYNPSIPPPLSDEEEAHIQSWRTAKQEEEEEEEPLPEEDLFADMPDFMDDAPSYTDEPVTVESTSAETEHAATSSAPQNSHAQEHRGGEKTSERPSQDSAPQEPAGSNAFFSEAYRLMEALGCNLSLMLTQKGSRLRLTVAGTPKKSSEDEGEGAAPFNEFVVEGRPDELDDAANGIEELLRIERQGALTLQEAKQRANEATEKAVAAERRREEKAKEKRKENSENGPLFSSDDDSGDGENGD